MEWKQIQFIIIYYLFYVWFRVQTYSEESELDLLGMFEWVQSYVQAEVVNRTTVRFSVYEMMLKNCGSTNTVSFKNVPVVGKNQFCVGFVMEIVKCRKMTTDTELPYLGGGVPCLSYLKILTQCSILL